MTLRLVILIALATVAARTTSADSDLAVFIEAERAHEGVPGLSIAVIRDYRIVWSQGFGVADTLTQARVTTDTPFPAASNAKPIAAWLVVQLAARGVIDLDKPVRNQAPVRLPDSPRHNRITPRHLLTHSSGLGNFLRDTTREVAFEPGERFAYSGVGFMLLQELLEAKSKQPLDTLARETLFVPLGMGRSWYGRAPSHAGTVAAPHVSLAYAAVPLGIIGAPALALVVLLALITDRLWTGAWHGRRALYLGLAAAPLVTAAALLYLSRSILMTIWFSALPLALAALLVIALRLTTANRLFSLAWIVVWALAFFVLRNAPLPLPTDDTANAASSLHASAPDLARFLIELTKPTISDTAATAEMTKAHQRIDAVASWGLGIGVERHANGRDLWQWGSNPGAKSLMIISPETGDGVVILTNGEVDGAFTRRIAARVLGRQGCWRTDCE